MNALHDAFLRDSLDVAEAIVSTGSVADFDQPDPSGSTALIYAAWRGCSHIVSMLLGHGVDITVENDTGFNALHVSAMHGRPGAAAMLLGAGASLDATHGDTGSTSLHMAKLLVDSGANVDQQAKNGETPLYMAATRGEVAVIRLLLAHGADPGL
ncbi:unnamed protein product, partial [Ectocarpus sp. 12 AP-2014]